MPIAFSYRRWSSAAQTSGTSSERQEDAAEVYCRAQNLVLSDRTFVDAGISAFKGKNAKEGELSTFLEQVDAGFIAPNSYLLIENFDRLSRQPVTVALKLFQSIIERGITIVTLTDRQVYSTSSINENWTQLIIMLSVASRAHEEQKRKGEMVRKAWSIKHRAALTDGVISTANGPSWLRLVDGRWTVLEAKADVVRYMFKLSLEGLGGLRIAKRLNDEGVATLRSAEFHTHGNVNSVLLNPTVYGLFRQGSGDLEVPNYYPAIVSKETFDAVQAGIQGRRGKGGAKQLSENLFAGMCRCGYCGKRLRFARTYVKGAPRLSYLRCEGQYAGSGCSGASVNYRAAEICVLHRLINVEELSLSQTYSIDTTASRVASIQEALVAANVQMERLVELSLSVPDIKVVADRLRQGQAKIDALKLELSELQSNPLTEHEVLQNRALFNALVDDSDSKLRDAAKIALRRQLTLVEVFAKFRDHPEFDISQLVDGRGQWPHNVQSAIRLTFAGGRTSWVKITPSAGKLNSPAKV